MNNVLRTMRIIHGAMLLAAFMYVWIAEKLNYGQSPRDISTFYMVLCFQIVLIVVIAFFFRRRFVSASVETLRTDPNNATALGRWRTGQIMSYAFAESVVLFGLVVRFTGATRMQAVPFYVVGILMLLVFYPQEP